MIKVVKERAPLVETYIQNMKPDPVLLQVPESDEHFLARVDFGKVINDDSYKDNKGNFAAKKSKLSFFKNSFGALGGISGSLRLTFHESGFVQMILMDSNGFDRQHYTFTFIRNDFLGNIPTAVFDVQPISGKQEYRTLLRTHLGGNPGRQRGPLQRRLRRQHPDHQGVLPLRQLAYQCAAGLVAANLFLCRRERPQEHRAARCSSKPSTTSGAMC